MVLTHQVVGFAWIGMKLHHPLWLDCVDTLWILASLAWSFSLRPMQSQLEIKVYDMFVNYVWPNYFWGKRLKVWMLWCLRFLEVVSAYGASPVVPCLISSRERTIVLKLCSKQSVVQKKAHNILPPKIFTETPPKRISMFVEILQRGLKKRGAGEWLYCFDKRMHPILRQGHPISTS